MQPATLDYTDLPLAPAIKRRYVWRMPEPCAVCSKWLPILRPVLRKHLFCVPLKEPVCEECEAAFWTNLIEASAERRRAEGQR